MSTRHAKRSRLEHGFTCFTTSPTKQSKTIVSLTRNEKTHDSTQFDTGPWLKDWLVLFDQAYFKYRRFARIDENDGYFVSRLKLDANPVITDELREWRASHALGEQAVQNVGDDFYRQHIDVEVEAEFKRRKYTGTRSQDMTLLCRLAE